MAKQRNTYAKRNREMDKKQKANEKRDRRKKREENKGTNTQPDYYVRHDDESQDGPPDVD
jgi:hypothetical protein